MKRLFQFLFCSAVAILGMSAQQPIEWKASVKMINAKEGVISLDATIQDGWHLYGTEIPANGPRPTSVDFSKSKGIELIGKLTPSTKPEEHMDSQFGIKLNYWAKDVTLNQKFRLKGKQAAVSVEATVKYMGCNDETCMPPKTANLTVPGAKFVKK